VRVECATCSCCQDQRVTSRLLKLLESLDALVHVDVQQFLYDLETHPDEGCLRDGQMLAALYTRRCRLPEGSNDSQNGERL
jgi:hypothetical protein